MKRIIDLTLFLAFLLPLSALAGKGDPSKIEYKEVPLVCGQTYTQEDLSGIQSGSITISDDGTTMIFENLNISDSSCLFDLGRRENYTVILKGENRIVTTASYVMDAPDEGMLKITGDGSLTTKSKRYDFPAYHSDIVIDNTTLISEGSTVTGNTTVSSEGWSNLVVIHSTFKGRGYSQLESLTLVGCAFVSPSQVFIGQYESGQVELKDANGDHVWSFEIQPIDGDFNNGVSAKDFGHILVPKGSAKNVDISMRNVGVETIREISYVLTIDGVSQPEQTYTFSEPYYETGMGFTVPVTFTATEKAVNAEASVTVTKVNGQDNFSDQKTAKGILSTLADGEPSRIRYRGETLVCGHTYTSADLADIQSGSMTLSADGASMTLENLHLNDVSSGGVLFETEKSNFAVILKGVNKISTKRNILMDLTFSTFTLTGEGSLTVESEFRDFCLFYSDMTIDNTTLICEGNNSICGDGGTNNVIVRNSTLKGSTLPHLASLTLLQCAIVSPSDATYTPNKGLTGADGDYVYGGFEIQPVEGDFNNRVHPWDFGTVIVMDSSKTMDISMKNEGENPIREISYVLTIGGVPQSEQTYTFSEPYTETGKNFLVPVTFTASETKGSAEVLLTVTKVNGQENTSDRNTAKGILFIINEAEARHVVIEEFTGTWCGWCTHGMVALDMLNKEFGDKVITIAVHDGDPMVAESYTQGAFELPSAKVNRGVLVDPYRGSSDKAYGIKEDVERELNTATPAGISISATWENEPQTSFKVMSETTFFIDADANQYGIGYALLEDGMKGTGSSWAQKNFYSGSSSDDPSLQPLTELPYEITDIEYDHVAVDAWGINEGVENSFKEAQAGVTQEKVYSCDILGNALIQDKSKLSVVVLLIDKTTGAIVNAAKTVISDYDPTAIRDIHTEKNDSSAIYSINGYKVGTVFNTPINSLPKGIYIIGGRKVVINK